MTLAQTVEKEIRKDVERGLTQKQLSEKYKIAQSYISRLLSGDNPVDGLTLHKVQDMFPNATLNLNINNIDNSGTINGNITQTFSGDTSEQLRTEILSQLLDMDIQEDVLVRIMRLVKETSVKK